MYCMLLVLLSTISENVPEVTSKQKHGAHQYLGNKSCQLEVDTVSNQYISSSISHGGEAACTCYVYYARLISVIIHHIHVCPFQSEIENIPVSIANAYCWKSWQLLLDRHQGLARGQEKI